MEKLENLKEITKPTPLDDVPKRKKVFKKNENFT